MTAGVNQVDIKKSMLAELLGTFNFVFAGTGAIIVNELTGAVSHVGIALTFGLVLTASIYAFGHISGAHFNPAVTVGFWASGTFPGRKVLYYLVAQLAGAFSASAVLLWMFGDAAQLGTAMPSAATTATEAFWMELILAFIFMTVFAASATHANAVGSFAGIAIGATFGFEALFAGPITGAAVNPARSIAPAVLSGTLEHLWIYIAATTLGAIVAGLLYRYMND